MNSLEKFQLWKEKATQQDVQKQLALMTDEQTIENCFYKDLQFGTGGLRGIMNAGTNCLNYYTIVKATFGIAKYMMQNNMHRVAVAYDSRKNSSFFAQTVARVFATQGIVAYLSEQCVPTPFLSFAVRELHCDIGVNITASHNPAEYNGYKVYGADGCQITDGVATTLIGYIDGTDPFEVLVEDASVLRQAGKILTIPQQLHQQFLHCLHQQSLGNANGLKVAYSPLNGTGYAFVTEILKQIDVEELHCVAEQSHPDGNFTTCPKPNPELDETLRRVIALAAEKQCDIAIATDPDCDRVGVAVLHNGQFVRLTGNEVGIVLTDYILQNLAAQNKLPKDGVLVKTIVTTALAEKIAQSYGMETINLLTGFKYIGEKIGELEKIGQKHRYVFGFEESCGYLKGTYVRDKDGVVAAMLVAEATAFYKNNGLTLVDRLQQLYAQYGTYQHKLVSYRFEGATGEAKKQQLLAHLRQHGLENIAGSNVTDVTDFLQGVNGLPISDVLQYRAEDGSQIIVRPSGTEPLIKTYITVCADVETNQQKLQQIVHLLDSMFN